MAELPVVLRAMVGLDANSLGGGGMGGGTDGGSLSSVISASPMERNLRNRFKPRLQAKGISSLSNIPEINRRNYALGELNRRISDMKEEPGLNTMTEINTRLQVPPNTTIINNVNGTIRRDSMTSNASSFYCSMKSADASRRSSQASQYSVVLSPPGGTAGSAGVFGMRANSNSLHVNYNTPSFYDPISPGSSRRSSQMSTTTTGGQSLPPQPSSTLLSTHLQRLQNSSNPNSNMNVSGRYSIPNTATMTSGIISNQLMCGSADRRMSEPVHHSADKEPLSPIRRPRSVTPKPAKSSAMNATGLPTLPAEHHPNQEVVLDEVEEGEMVEDKLIIPEEFLDYLNQVDCANHTISDLPAVPKTNTNVPNNNDQSISNNENMDISQSLNNHMWRNPSSNLYSMASPSTQPQSPASAISQIMSPNPQQTNANIANTCGNHNANQSQQSKVPLQQTGIVNQNQNQAVNYNNPNRNKSYYNYSDQQQQQYQPPSYNAFMHQQQTYAAPTGPLMHPNSSFNACAMNFAAASNRDNSFQQHADHSNSTMMPTSRVNACTQTPGYFHRTDQSAMNCCQLLSALQISEDSPYNNKQESVNNINCMPPTTGNHTLSEIQCGDISQSNLQLQSNSQRLTQVLSRPAQIQTSLQQPQPLHHQQQTQLTHQHTTIYPSASWRKKSAGENLPRTGKDSRSANPNPSAINANPTVVLEEEQSQQEIQQPSRADLVDMQQQSQQDQVYQTPNANNVRCECINDSSQLTQQPCMYHSNMRQDTFQRTLEYVQNCQSWAENTETVTSSTHPSSNMIINDLSSSLNSLLEENRFLQMIQ